MLELSDRIVQENGLTTMMITHNMKDAIRHGNRLIMMNKGEIIFDCRGEEKAKLTVEDLLEKFAQISGSTLDNDRGAARLSQQTKLPEGNSLRQFSVSQHLRRGFQNGSPHSGTPV